MESCKAVSLGRGPSLSYLWWRSLLNMGSDRLCLQRGLWARGFLPLLALEGLRCLVLWSCGHGYILTTGEDIYVVPYSDASFCPLYIWKNWVASIWRAYDVWVIGIMYLFCWWNRSKAVTMTTMMRAVMAPTLFKLDTGQGALWITSLNPYSDLMRKVLLLPPFH